MMDERQRFGFWRWTGEIILTWEVVLVVYYIIEWTLYKF